MGPVIDTPRLKQALQEFYSGGVSPVAGDVASQGERLATAESDITALKKSALATIEVSGKTLKITTA